MSKELRKTKWVELDREEYEHGRNTYVKHKTLFFDTGGGVVLRHVPVHCDGSTAETIVFLPGHAIVEGKLVCEYHCQEKTEQGVPMLVRQTEQSRARMEEQLKKAKEEVQREKKQSKSDRDSLWTVRTERREREKELKETIGEKEAEIAKLRAELARGGLDVAPKNGEGGLSKAEGGELSVPEDPAGARPLWRIFNR